jgi:transcriptional regulator with XRE-family HTH domain
MSKTTGMVVMGSQIRAARSLLGWSQDELARAANLHLNAVAYWEQTVSIPTGRHQPHACRKIAEALRRFGVEFVGHAKPGVRLVQNHNFFMRPPSRARAHHGVKRLLRPWGMLAPTKTVPSGVARRQPSSPCGARTRSGARCRRKGLDNGRCLNHGGLSSGPKTPAGRARIAEAQRKRWAKWRDCVAARRSEGPNNAQAR